MGLFFKKRIKLAKGLHLNLSKSGLGLSFGVKGCRISTGPKGTFLNASSNGLYFRKKLNKKSKQSKESELQETFVEETPIDIYRTAAQINFEKKFNIAFALILISFLSIIFLKFFGIILFISALIYTIRLQIKNPELYKEFLKNSRLIANAKKPKVNYHLIDTPEEIMEKQERQKESKYREYKYSYETYKQEDNNAK
jgi:hypothetical protein